MGETIHAATHQWLYNKVGFRVEPTEAWNLNQEIRVGQLFDSIQRGWNEQLLRSLATPEDVTQIMSIPIPNQEKKDTIMWRYTDHGRVSVKTAYHRLKEATEMTSPDIN